MKILNEQQPIGQTVCEKCKRDVRDAFTRPLDASCEACSTAELIPPMYAAPRSGFIAWCVREAEKASGPVYNFFPPARRWSVASMGDAAFKNWCRAELKKADREPATAEPVREILGKQLAEKMGQAFARMDARGRGESVPAGFDPNAFTVVQTH